VLWPKRCTEGVDRNYQPASPCRQQRLGLRAAEWPSSVLYVGRSTLSRARARPVSRQSRRRPATDRPTRTCRRLGLRTPVGLLASDICWWRAGELCGRLHRLRDLGDVFYYRLLLAVSERDCMRELASLVSRDLRPKTRTPMLSVLRGSVGAGVFDDNA